MICRASKKLNVLKLRDLFFMKIVNSMWDDDNNFLPTCFNNYFPHARELFIIVKLDSLLVTKLVKLGTTSHQDMD